MIREGRARKGWTQLEWAERIGKTKPTISEWEREYRRPGIDDINSIVTSLNLSADALLIKMGILLTPPLAAKLPRNLLLDLVTLSESELEALTLLVGRRVRPVRPPQELRR